MLMNGQKVNYLVLNGEKFTSETYLPAKYIFGAKSAPFYKLKFDDNSKIVMEYETRWGNGGVPEKSSASLLGNHIVSRIIIVDGEQYALTYCQFSAPGGGAEGSVWIKSSEAGGMTRIEATGGK